MIGYFNEQIKRDGIPIDKGQIEIKYEVGKKYQLNKPLMCFFIQHDIYWFGTAKFKVEFDNRDILRYWEKRYMHGWDVTGFKIIEKLT